jgi:putative NIF3 family GTP cyclohydrolase 1 type 2
VSTLCRGVIASFLIVWVTSAVAGAHAQQPAAGGAITARQVIERIKANVAIPWMPETVDTFKAGDPDARVTCIAVTMMATYDVLKRAADAGCNLVITHEPTFFGHQDDTADLARENDPTYAAKRALIESRHLVIWRFHDHWHRRKPDGIQVGMLRALGWEKSFQLTEFDAVGTVPEQTLEQLAATVRQRLGASTLRVVGDPKMKVTRVALAPGFSGFQRNRAVLRRPDVQVLVIGEGHEWETIEYAADAATSGAGKGLIAIGHIPSEQAGMEECARWLRTFVREVPVQMIEAKDPFWSPAR